ncbi:MAG: esterase, partial [Mesonia sp.]
GGIPKELSPQDFEFLTTTQVELWYGTEDEYLTEKRIYEETRRTKEMFGEALKIVPFEGKHIVNRELINELGIRN